MPLMIKIFDVPTGNDVRRPNFLFDCKFFLKELMTALCYIFCVYQAGFDEIKRLLMEDSYDTDVRLLSHLFREYN